MGSAISAVSKGPIQFTTKLSNDAEGNALKATRRFKIYSEYLDFIVLSIKTPVKAMEDRELLVGRQISNDVIVSNNTVSGKHGAFTYNAKESEWTYKDIGSSTGSIMLSGDKTTKLQADTPVPLGLTAGIRLGRAVLTIVSDNVNPAICIECTAGERKGESWLLDSGRKSLSIGSHRSNKCVLAASDIQSKHLKILKFSGWWAAISLQGDAKSTVNGVKTRVNELIYLWIGAVIKVGSSTTEQFVVKGALK